MDNTLKINNRKKIMWNNLTIEFKITNTFLSKRKYTINILFTRKSNFLGSEAFKVTENTLNVNYNRTNFVIYL